MWYVVQWSELSFSLPDRSLKCHFVSSDEKEQPVDAQTDIYQRPLLQSRRLGRQTGLSIVSEGVGSIQIFRQKGHGTRPIQIHTLYFQ